MKDAVNHPAHYAEGRQYEPIDVIRDWDLNFNLGSSLKYIARTGRKDDAIEDLKKAVFYIQHEISVLELEEQQKLLEVEAEAESEKMYIGNNLIRSLTDETYNVKVSKI